MIPMGTQQMFVWGGSAPRSNPSSFYIPFSRERYPFRIPSIDQWYPFHITCIELCIPFNCCKCTVFEIGINHKIKRTSRLYIAIKITCQPFWALSQTQFNFLLFFLLQLVNSQPFHTPEACKRYPFRAEPPSRGHHMEYPPPPPSRDCDSS